MLKIKDNVDLKKLGFEEFSFIYFDKDSFLGIDKQTRIIIAIPKSIDKLFYLIQLGLVEKVVN